jgi:drug/metabolite transporter (DMT)-like permease
VQSRTGCPGSHASVKSPSLPLLPALAALTNATVWGLSWWPLRWLETHGVPVLWTTLLVFGACTVSVLLWRPRAFVTAWQWPALWWLALAAGLTNICFNIALATGDVVRCVLLFYLMPVWVVPLARWLLHEPITAAACGRLGLALLGAVLVLGKGKLILPWPNNVADWLALLAGVAFALNNVLLRRLAHVPAEGRGLAMFAGAVLLAPLGMLALDLVGKNVAFSPHHVAWLGLGLFTAAVLIGNLALQYGAAKLRANTLSLLMLAEILVASLSSWLAGAAKLDAATLLGGLLIASASVLAVAWPGAAPLAAEAERH